MSGTATAPWALADNARERGLKFATSVGCKTDNGTEHIIHCLKQRPAERLLRAVDQFLVSALKLSAVHKKNYLFIGLAILTFFTIRTGNRAQTIP
jgi:Carboxylesterase family